MVISSGRKGPVAVLLAALVIMGTAIGYKVWSTRQSAAPAPAPSASASPDSLETLRARAEATGDAQSWQQVGYAYFENGQFDQAADAYRKETQAAPNSAVAWSSLGEALVMANTHGDPIPAEARAAFKRAASLDPGDPRTRYFLAVEKDLVGDHRGAIDAWLALLADTPRGAPWEADLVRTIRQVGKINKIPVEQRIASVSENRPPAAMQAPSPALAGIPGPTQQDLAAASAIPPSQQQKMVQGMVEGLAARLQSQPNDVDGWIMLMRSYKTLGQDAKAKDALARALAANPGASQQLHEAATQLGV